MSMQTFTYTKPNSAHEAIQAMTRFGDQKACFLSGGTTLVDLMKLDVERPEHIIDITAIPELTGFDVSGTSELIFGALARMSDVASDPFMRQHYRRRSGRPHRNSCETWLPLAAIWCSVRAARTSATRATPATNVCRAAVARR